MTLPQELKDRYLEALLRRDPVAASAAVEEGIQRGWSATRIYLEVLAEALIRIGDLWHAGQVNVAQEHLATQITLDQMDHLRQRFQVSSKRGIQAVVACVAGNTHYLGARMIADLFLLDGWDVEFLGADTPTHDLVEFVRQSHPGLVALSVTLEVDLVAAGQAIADLRQLPDPPAILVGGRYAGVQPEAMQELGADAIATDGISALQEAQRLLGISLARLDLTGYLLVLGQRVQELRRELRWSQEQLAQSAGLDRTYISAVENGRQNLTLGAVVKLADALGVSLGQLLKDGNTTV